jgi:Protein phosphatase 2C
LPKKSTGFSWRKFSRSSTLTVVPRCDRSAWLHAQTETEPGLAEAATTVVAAVVTASCALIAHLGDSRAYLHRDQQVHRLTRDHSITQTLIDAVEITAPRPPIGELLDIGGHLSVQRRRQYLPGTIANDLVEQRRANAGPDQSHGLSDHSREGAPTHAASPRTIHRF